MTFALRQLGQRTIVRDDVWLRSNGTNTTSPLLVRPYVGEVSVRLCGDVKKLNWPQALKNAFLHQRKHLAPFPDVAGEHSSYVLAVLRPRADYEPMLEDVGNVRINGGNGTAYRAGLTHKTVREALLEQPEMVLIVLHSTDGEQWDRRVYKLAA